MAVTVRQGSPQQVVVEGAPDDLAQLQTTVADGRLTVDTKSGADWKAFLGSHPSLGKVTVRITMPTINALSVSSSGSLKAATVRADNLALGVSSSGHVGIGQLQAAELHPALSSSGSIRVGGGTCPRQEVAISGSGSVEAAGLQSEAGEARISSSGNCRLRASQTLDAHLSGPGGVYVLGNPKITSRTSGSARVRPG